MITAMNFLNFQKNSNKASSISGGFTLIEMIVSMSIFTVIMLMIVGALISLDNAARKARAVRLVTDNLSAAIDSMSRNIRMGSTFHCGCEATAAAYATPKDCSFTDTLGNGGEACFAFEGQNGNSAVVTDQIVYQLSGNRIQRSVDAGTTFLDLTAPELKVNDLRFFVYGSAVDQDQPVVTMLLRGVAGITAKDTTNFNLQTTISGRTSNFAP